MFIFVNANNTYKIVFKMYSKPNLYYIKETYLYERGMCVELASERSPVQNQQQFSTGIALESKRENSFVLFEKWVLRVAITYNMADELK